MFDKLMNFGIEKLFIQYLIKSFELVEEVFDVIVVDVVNLVVVGRFSDDKDIVVVVGFADVVVVVKVKKVLVVEIIVGIVIVVGVLVEIEVVVIDVVVVRLVVEIVVDVEV